MTYAIANPPRCVSQSVGANGGDIWVYKDGDSLDDVAGNNYVTNASDVGLVAGDLVVHMDETDLVTNLLSVVTAAKGTAVGATCSAIEPIAETSIALSSAGTGSILIDDIITFDNDTTEYLVTTGDADVSGGGTLVITPGLVVATAVGTVITVKQDVLNLSTGKTGRKVHTSGGTRLIQPSESGDMFLMTVVSGQVFTLPAAVVGLKYSFLVTADLTSNDHDIDAASGDFFLGAIYGGIEALATGETHFADGTADLTINQNFTTTGGLIGSWCELECITTSIWSVTGVFSCTATPLTPFLTS